MGKSYLKRRSGVSIEILIKSLKENKIFYFVEKQEASGKYFRENVVRVKNSLKWLWEQHVISSVQQIFFNEKERYIELNATYNYLVPSLDGTRPHIDENYLEITNEYAEKLGVGGADRPSDWPIDKIRVYEID